MEKIQPPRHLSQISIWSGGLGTSEINRHSIKLSRNKMDSKVIKSY